MLLLTNGKIHSMAGRNYDVGCILIDGGKILEISDYIDVTGDDLEVLDLQGAWVMPGLIEAHCHLGITEEKKGQEGDDCNEMVDPITPYLRALDAINPMDAGFRNAVRAGITGVMVGPGSSNVVGGQFVFLKTAGRCIDEMVVLEPAAMKVAFGENPKTTYSNLNVMPTTRMSVAALLREALFEARQYRDSRRGGDAAADFRQECWLPVLDGRIPLKAHAHRADDILTALRIAREFGVRLTLDHCTEGHFIAQEICAAGFPAIVGPSIASRNKIEVQFMDFKTPGLLAKAGVTVAITTDHPVSLIQYLPICAGLAAREGLGVEEALRAITANAAQICGVGHRTGVLATGLDADIAVFDGNPMEVFTRTLYTLIDGRIVYRYDQQRDESTYG